MRGAAAEGLEAVRAGSKGGQAGTVVVVGGGGGGISGGSSGGSSGGAGGWVREEGCKPG